MRRPAAVVLGIVETAPYGVIFIERAAHLRNHAGQIGLPGGGMDPVDGADLRATALREMNEEVGVAPGRVTIVGELPAINARVNNYTVTPFVATVAPGDLRIDATETAGVFTVPLERVVNDLRQDMVWVGAFKVHSPVLDHAEKRIWGLTGYILRAFVSAWNDPENSLRARVEARLSSK
ncbi:MAG TPA: CoA pyrophosphatase [Alphaproteobacteria bacterium]|nr:CoA pyrophosphatase [Alphaproteobacteria bacterium]